MMEILKIIWSGIVLHYKVAQVGANILFVLVLLGILVHYIIYR